MLARAAKAWPRAPRRLCRPTRRVGELPPAETQRFQALRIAAMSHSPETTAQPLPPPTHPTQQPATPTGSWTHVLAWAATCATLALIAMGGLVTTYGAGMAVPDWPNTFGYNLFLYPLESWLAVWDVFLEHSHRLLGAAVGLLTIALALALWLGDRRRAVKWLALAALAGVVLQGLLGGLRVLGNEVFLAKVHGCTGPAFFALAAALVTLTSPGWRARAEMPGSTPAFGRAAWMVAAIIYLQIVLGANLRHQDPEAGTGGFRLWVWLHVIVAGLVVGAAAGLRLWARPAAQRPIVMRRAGLLALLLALQALLGIAAWVVRYGIPGWFADWVWELPYTVQAHSPLQALIVTAHVAVGSLALATAVTLGLWSAPRGMQQDGD